MQHQQKQTKSPAPTQTEQNDLRPHAELTVMVRPPQYDQPVEIEISNPAEKISIGLQDVDYIIFHLQKFKQLVTVY